MLHVSQGCLRTRIRCCILHRRDGTVNETVNGIAQGGFKSTFGFIPVSTVNDMSRALGIHQNPTQAIKRIDINQTHTIDIGRCNNNISAIISQPVLFQR